MTRKAKPATESHITRVTESVWDYPRPPVAEPCSRRICVVFNNQVIAETTRSIRVLETSHPPVYYIPPADVKPGFLKATDKMSFCEFKGPASYLNVSVDKKVALKAAFTYSDPTPQFKSVRNYVAFYAGPMDACYVDDEVVAAQPGGFYAGWITSDITGPFKGEPGTWGW